MSRQVYDPAEDEYEIVETKDEGKLEPSKKS